MRTIERTIASAFIFSADGKLLLGHSGVFGATWGPTGGGIEPGESSQEAVIREVREETGIDISDATIERLGYELADKSEKILRDTGEEVLVDMTFHDFMVILGSVAADVALMCADDFSGARWFDKPELITLDVSAPCAFSLHFMGLRPEAQPSQI